MTSTVTLKEQTGNAYHKHEKLVQRLAGVDVENREGIGRRFIRSYMPDQHREFFMSLQLLFVGIRDDQERPVATALTGPKGFIASPSPTELVISPHQILGCEYKEGKPIGLLGLEFPTRRRNRMNGTIDKLEDGRLHIRVEESFGNCPKYIQIRHLLIPSAVDGAPVEAAAAPGQVVSGQGPVPPEQAILVREAATFFIASHHKASPDDAAKVRSGCDVSHRGGAPGFVQIDAPGDRLRFADYIGNNFFQTLGNIHANHQAGLLFIDFQTGATLQLKGEADIDAADKSLPGAERTVTIRIIDWVYAHRGLPLRSIGPVELSPYNPRPSDQSSASRAFVSCTAVEDAAQGIKTFRFSAPEAIAGNVTPKFGYTAGQFSSFDIPDPSGSGKVLNRTWTISSHPDEASEGCAFSITVKRVDGGAVSPWLHARLGRGGILEWRGVDGEFTSRDHPGPALLIAAGIGITPLRSMLLEFLKRGRQATLLYSVRAVAEAAFLEELAALAAARPLLFRLVVTVTGRDESWSGRTGRIGKELMREQIEDAGSVGVYTCGPEAFMAAIAEAAKDLGVPPQQVFMESFNF